MFLGGRYWPIEFIEDHCRKHMYGYDNLLKAIRDNMKENYDYKPPEPTTPGPTAAQRAQAAIERFKKR